MLNQNPEQIARDQIDSALVLSGWIVQSIKQVNLNAGIGVAVKEYTKKRWDLENGNCRKVESDLL
jgi:type I site-specific restriction endonuclease